jgi:broad-specificity NMP kinase
VKSCTHAQTDCSTEKETAEGEYIALASSCISRFKDFVQKKCTRESCQSRDQVSVDVDGLIVKVKEASKRFVVTTRWSPVTAVNVVVVLLPIRYIIPMYQ